MTTETIPVPDLGGADEVDVIEICVAVGDTVQPEDSLIVLESDKASMEIPSPRAGKVVEIKLAVGDKVGEGAAMVVLEVADAPAAEAEQPSAAAGEGKKRSEADAAADAAARGAPIGEAFEPENVEPESPAEDRLEVIDVPELGSADEVDVIEVCVKPGDEIAEGDSLVVLESDKASMDVPSPKSGVVKSVKVAEGDKVSSGSVLLEMMVRGGGAAAQPSQQRAPQAQTAQGQDAAQNKGPAEGSAHPPAAKRLQPAATEPGADVYAGPAVRKLARELGVNLTQVPGSGPKNRVVKEDVQRFVQEAIRGGGAAGAGSGIPAVPEVDFAQFGKIDIQPMSKLHRVTAANMHRSWLNVPHVTQFDEADITELEAFRKQLKTEAEARGTKLTPLPLLLKACAVALKAHPKINASLAADGEHVVYKQYVHIGMAVDTPAGLLVPVIRDVDRKTVWELAEETAVLAEKARNRKLSPAEMQGGCFTVSSLGPIGGQGFTPVVNTPEVAILGVSKLAVKPVWNGSEFAPRQMLPLALSYDHRAVNGGDAGRFMTDLVTLLGDIRRLLL